MIGLGHIAQVAVRPAFAHARNSELTALVSGDPEKLEVLGRRYEVARRFHYDALDECLRHVDAVYVCTPNSEHAAMAIRAAQAGVRVLCEKPLAVTDAECEAMIAASEAAGVRLMTAYRLHFEPLTLEILEHVRAGRLGELRYVEAALVVLEGRRHDQFAAELVYFSNCVRHGHAPEPSGREGAWDVRIVDAILESARRGETIALRPFTEPDPRRDQAIALPPAAKPPVIKAPEPHD